MSQSKFRKKEGLFCMISFPGAGGEHGDAHSAMVSENQEKKMKFNERVFCNYDEQKLAAIECEKTILQAQIKKLAIWKVSMIFENQEKIAASVVDKFRNKNIVNVMVLSQTQSGKTGSMLAFIQNYFQDPDNLIPIENIYIITGLSSCEWKEQTKERMPECIQDRVFHRGQLPSTFVDEVKNKKKNIIIIMDEVHIAAKTEQTICKVFGDAGLLDEQKLFENDIKILEYTATPDGTIYDLMKWGNSSAKIIADAGSGYVSSHNLLTVGRVRQFKDLCGYNKHDKSDKNDKGFEKVFMNINELVPIIENYNIPRYHIIRTKNGIEQQYTINNFKRVFNPTEYSFIKYDKDSEIEDINKTLLIQPTKHTFIFIKEMLRCAKTLKKKFIGILYERYTSQPDDTTIIQGLVGRDTGYDNNGESIVFTNIESIVKYEKLWKSGFEDVTIIWNSKTTTNKDGNLSGRNTFNDPTLYQKLVNSDTESDDFDSDADYFQNKDDIIEDVEPIIVKRKTQEEIKEYYDLELKSKFGWHGRGPAKRKPNAQGFYESTIGKGKDRKRVRSDTELQGSFKYGLRKKTNHYTLHPCYSNTNDKKTIEWWFIHYPTHTVN